MATEGESCTLGVKDCNWKRLNKTYMVNTPVKKTLHLKFTAVTARYIIVSLKIDPFRDRSRSRQYRNRLEVPFGAFPRLTHETTRGCFGHNNKLGAIETIGADHRGSRWGLYQGHGPRS